MSRQGIPKKALIRQKKNGARITRLKPPPDSSEDRSRSSSADSERGFLEGPLDPQLFEEVSNLDEEQEDLRDYCPGGYYPAEIGETLSQRYRILRKLGWGHFSTVWLVSDSATDCYAAVKIMKSARKYKETALDELALLKAASAQEQSSVVRLMDHFEVTNRGSGTHICMVLEVLGDNLLRPIVQGNYSGLSIPLVKHIIRQVLTGLSHLHSVCGIIHTDIKPENILLQMDPVSLEVLAAECVPAYLLPYQAVSSLCLYRQRREHSQAVRREAAIKERDKQELELQSMQTAQQINGLCCKIKVNSCKTNNNSCKVEENSCLTKEEKQKIRRKQKKKRKKEKAKIAKLTYTATTESELVCQDLKCDKLEPIIPQFIDTHGNNEGNDIIIKQKVPRSFSMDDIHEIQLTEDLLLGREESLECVNNHNLAEFDVKIADLGNACWVDKHFSENIQTRQYRAIEVLLGIPYSTSADIWSVACLAFELATGDYLFEPHQGDTYSRDEDHIALVTELLGSIPRHIALKGKYSKEFFNKKGDLRHIHRLEYWPLKDILVEKYRWELEEAELFSNFLMPMLNLVPGKRATADQCLASEWLFSKCT
ncbi:hypothetical protein LOD99_11509 [Oopsacas minuta]|uniref:non-specific serine/threonine protein kinase n=1 Tax=Oopsacas minuta TaxID=111878 RepID=A0AAV7JJP2_9METZ|nr:hypothetical protein LOD99_11509 [Oopsacas minuta]